MEHKLCINSYSGRIFDPTAAALSDLCIEDIAHALSLLCRPTDTFIFSTPWPSTACLRAGSGGKGWSRRVQLLCLLHDASEAYLGDLTRPLKRHLPAFYEIEERLQAQILAALGVAAPTEAERAWYRKSTTPCSTGSSGCCTPWASTCRRGSWCSRCTPAQLPCKQVEDDYLAAFAALRKEA